MRNTSWLVRLFLVLAGLAPSAALASEDPFTSGAHWIVFAVTSLIVVICVLVHYEVLNGLTRIVSIAGIGDRPRVLLVIFGILLVHVAEIWIFGGGYILLRDPVFGTLAGLSTMDPFDYIYYSAVVYSTLGFGDLVPDGPIRFLTGVEAVTGLVLITWSASFTFIEMQRFWKVR